MYVRASSAFGFGGLVVTASSRRCARGIDSGLEVSIMSGLTDLRTGCTMLL
jgi:hypothetical protein